ncbi:hypothetical protein A3H80_04360 [Candidatus Roizmanbacteria bacterium RIFCSPLOWO2_02_FULL_37_19]|uniref:Sortase n=1 Tax=Candidatus Roizmanbacteria bacterium RIFCSPHIGHO2_02_FULL_37_24 TaxID=1802037 RepID=A0A1F7GXA9_9BACT|nr:MAG: hypothetical protein A2862_03990 [Candidatus Roizmanbacteria bacterium RIFCSPHIGHO2_01_FULL_38_41]OGK23122.1 MAG: hypothetical protein A3C24_01390 [Candidatus Roizmanbacteria bacterium RIFCSPHIGHO2_02_FULL_37_24]OGK32845.1 MAG: hypothetical protein A3E10_00050 [Candidatus Roizmanbacteria bacterium RIFCSPHIGHO2_12_FULL_37_23]OGK45478.1 MAG: hypothetical protein A2956_00110 [Candidatus Roizmanbacteria bacterium RIFCSPLOWO2_01_FULL_37_57]OGK54258.1 MAG: hypothetical protein A3H80_04360 [Ca
MTTSEYIRILFLRTLGNFLVLFSIFMLAWVFYKPALEEIKYAANQITGKKYILVDEAQERPRFTTTSGSQQKGLLAQALHLNDIEVLVPKDPNFSIVIPKLGANANVLSNVNPSDENIYKEALQQGVAHAEGSKLPGENGHIYLFAHSTNTFANVGRYNAVFYLLYKLDPGDEVNLYFKGVRYKYVVTGKEVVNPSDVQYLTRQTDREFLTLQTCWPPGTIYQRMLIFAEPTAR